MLVSAHYEGCKFESFAVNSGKSILASFGRPAQAQMLHTELGSEICQLKATGIFIEADKSKKLLRRFPCFRCMLAVNGNLDLAGTFFQNRFERTRVKIERPDYGIFPVNCY
jgi:hypothetical protein